MAKKVLIIHNRVGGVDGVSLEISKRIKVLRDLGCKVFTISGGFGNNGVKPNKAFVLPSLKINSPSNKKLLNRIFFSPNANDYSLEHDFKKRANYIYKQLYKLIAGIQPNLVFVHNMFSLAYNLPASIALKQVLDKLQIPNVFIHHDFWWERKYFKVKNYKSLHFIKALMRKILPYNASYIIAHEVINSLALKELLKRKNIKAKLSHDFWEFDKTYKTHSVTFIRNALGLPKDSIIILNATRIVQRKNIETAIRLVAVIKEHLPRNMANNVILLFPNFVEVGAKEYVRALKKLAKKLNVKLLFAYSLFRNKLTFWDAYKVADIVTYMPIWEGFGNQLLEAIYFKKPIALFEYKVFKQDIAKHKLFYFSVGDKYYKRNGLIYVPKDQLSFAARNLAEIIKYKVQNKKYPENVKKGLEHNYRVLEKFYSTEVLIKRNADLCTDLNIERI